MSSTINGEGESRGESKARGLVESRDIIVGLLI